MIEENNIGDAADGDRDQDADGDKEASSHGDSAGGMGKGGATHNDFGKDSGIHPEVDQARDSKN